MSTKKEAVKKPKLSGKVTPLDIVSRVLTCGVMAAIPFIAYYVNLIFIEFHSAVGGAIATLSGRENDSQMLTYDYFSINRIRTEILPMLGNDRDSGALKMIWDLLAPYHGWIYATVVFFAIVLLLAVAIFVISAVSNSNKLPLILSGAGLISLIAMAVCFRQVTAPIVSGELDIVGVLVQKFGSGQGDGLVSSLISLLVSLFFQTSESGTLDTQALIDFDTINFSTAWVTMIGCFFAMAVWHGAMLIVSLGENDNIKADKADRNGNGSKHAKAK